jgi:hypothetical protein
VDVVLSDATAGGDALSAAVAVLAAIAGSRPQVDPDTGRLTAAEDVSIRRPTLDEVFLAETDAANDRETEAAA